MQKDNSLNNKKDLINTNKIKIIKCLNSNVNYRKIEKIAKNNLPELKLSKPKSRIESKINISYKQLNQANISIRNINDIPKKKLFINNKSKKSSLLKKNEIIFPKIVNSLKNNNIYQQYEKYNKDLNNYLYENNSSISNDYINCKHNTINNSQIILNKLQNKLEKEKGINNKISEFHKIKPKKQKSISSSQVSTKNRNNKESSEKKFRHHLLLQAFQKSNISNLSIPILNLSLSTNNNNLEKNINNEINNEDNKIPNNNINNNKSLQNKAIKQSLSSKNLNLMADELKELDNISDKLNKINILLNKISPQYSQPTISSYPLINNNSILNNIYLSSLKSIDITPDILKKSFPNFEESVTSYINEFSGKSNILIKGYAYNTSKGNIRNYNEDTITVEKIKLKKNKNNSNNENYFYFFGIYDGHGGNGCSLYLKENLHNFIQEFSVRGIKEAIYESENEFLTKKAIDEKNNICDASGSCGIIAMIKNNKLIISNIGDSRIVIYKNEKIFFVTEDHKPNSEKEKERIKNAGGQLYQSPSIIPIYQNGKKVNLPWRVLPGRLSVSRTFGDIEAKNEKYGGKKGVIIPMPDITEIELNNEFDFMVIGCDGIFDVLSNEDLLEIWNISLKERKLTDKENINNININELCGKFAELIIKSALAKHSFDNVSCIVVVFNINNYMDEQKIVIKDKINNCSEEKKEDKIKLIKAINEFNN